MAVKERKQITGTTAQINAYEGHEGQIVWDKEKKTFVGMSGTAGKNYPLAPKEYVDNEVAKVNTELTEGLAGKEDKGTCLPLSGGLVSGDIDLDPNFRDGNINIGFNFTEKLGGGVGFRSINHTKEPGAFSLYAQDLTQCKVLNGRPDGTLTWNGSPIITQAHHSGNTVGNSWQNVFRFSNGLQIIYGVYGGVPSANNGVTVTYDSPFVSTPSTQATVWGADYLITNPTASVYIANPSETNFRIWSSLNNWIYWCAFGKWE
ncbi:MAG: hypothetical protein JJO33_00365 [Escherichia coli]|nr:hypothetical protein [Escherichia coli]